jgi:SAM-dependent methyltransferase
VSEQGLKFGPAAADYERGRPSWPAEAVAVAADRLALAPTATVVDIGAGTGKLARRLVERFARVIAVEPLPEMRAWLRRVPGIEIRDGTAERLPLPDGTADAVFAGDAFHWFDAPAALAEAARVLTPDGGIVLLWNGTMAPSRWEPPLPEPALALVRAAITRGGEPGGPRVVRGEWRAGFAGSRFGELQHVQVDHELSYDRDEVIAHAMSISSIAGLPVEHRQALRAEIRDLVPDVRYRQRLRVELYCSRLLRPIWCDRCGGALAGRDHTGCGRALEPPRYCRYCRRRMKVQVLPAGWSATCVAHGVVNSA